MDKKNFTSISLQEEMQRSYLEYAMSVIVGRALPDARDGLKPVQRRIIFAMHELGLTPDKPFRKCARVVGDVLGKYHPHGDQAVYDALVKLVQNFSTKYPTLDGHGNFGSVDNDPPAAMRYTETRLAPIAHKGFLEEIGSETVSFSNNFDGSQKEPDVLPAQLPFLLLNGSSGIAVGMATNIPPHNLGEIVDGLVALVKNKEINDKKLSNIVKGPDFPTGGELIYSRAIEELYQTGKGSITIRGVVNTEEVNLGKGKHKKNAIIIKELPYQINKAGWIEKLAELVNTGKIIGISDIRDESDRDGMRIVIELKRDAYPQVVLNNLFKLTPLQNNFSANILALVKGEPTTLTLRKMLDVFLDFRVETIKRRTGFLLNKAEERDHIVKGLLLALGDMDEIINLIRSAKDTVSAREKLQTDHELSTTQAEAILQMQLRRLTALEADKIKGEHNELTQKINQYQQILNSKERIFEIILEELDKIDERFSSPRKTEILDLGGGLDDIDLIANDRSVVLLTEAGYLKRMPVNEFESTSRGSRGKAGTKTQEDDEVKLFISCNDHDTLLLFSDRGVSYALPAYRVPMSSRTAKGTPSVQLLPIPREEKLTSLVAVDSFDNDCYLLMLTRAGFIKRSSLSAFSKIRSNGLIAINLEDGDALTWVRLSKEGDSVLIGSRTGMAIHFRLNIYELRPLGRTARGVKSMNLRKGDNLVSMDVLTSNLVDQLAKIEELTEDLDDNVEENSSNGPWVLIASAFGLGKRVPVAQFRLQKRAGMGLRAIKFRIKDDQLVCLKVLGEGEELLLVTEKGVIVRTNADKISQQSRAATGVKLQRLDDGDHLSEVVLVPHEQIEETDQSNHGKEN